MIRITALFLMTLMMSVMCFAHSGKARYHIIIDTDGAVDDLRAITLFLASNEFEVIAITCSNGALKSKEACVKVESLLEDFGHQGIPVAYSTEDKFEKQKWYEFSTMVSWGALPDDHKPTEKNAVDLIIESIMGEDEKVCMVCLGGFTNINNAIKKQAGIVSGIEKIFWYNDQIKPLSGVNYDIDEEAAKEMLEREIMIDVIGASKLIKESEINQISSIRNRYAQKIGKTHENVLILEKIKSAHLRYWDDFVPMWMLFPEQFKTEKYNDQVNFISDPEDDFFLKKYMIILNSESLKQGKVFSTFPVQKSIYREDVQPHIDSLIVNRGMEEFRCGVITNELHGHLGIYAIIGMKMGLRARQYYNIGVDDINIVSYAGSKPPISCLNDGLQVSTGGTVGHGLIQISEKPEKIPEAEFEFKGKKIKISLKEEHWQLIRKDVKEGIDKYGNLSTRYWEHIRSLAIKYWVNWDRMDIFEITVY